MKKIVSKMIILLLVLSWKNIPAMHYNDEPEECAVMIAGKNTTVDGSILFVKSEDDGFWDIDYLWVIPRKSYENGAIVKLEAGGTIPQVKETYAYFWDECPNTSFSNMIINEWGVAFGSNGCRSREDPIEQVAACGDLVNGGLGFKLRLLLAQRSKTAREAVLLATKLIDEYGYYASGRNLNIVGPNEAWQLQMVRGKQYVARRVQDDEVAIIANTFSIRDVDMDDRENFICSPKLIEYAIRRGWYDPEKGEKFDFAKAYANPNTHINPRNTHRQWNMARLLDKNFSITWEQAQTGIMPVSVKPTDKLSLKDAMDIFRDHYEGTILDQSVNYTSSPHETKVATICRNATHKTAIIQQRNWLPQVIGTLIWRSMDKPCSGGYVPWYLGTTRIPEVFQKAPESIHKTTDILNYHFNMPKETWSLDLESSSGIFRLLGILVDANYKNTIDIVQKRWLVFEETELRLQEYIEKTALDIYQKDESLAKEFLTSYSSAQALKSVEIAKDLIKICPPTLGSYIKLGMLHIFSNNSKRALQNFEKGLELAPENTAIKRYKTWVQDIISAMGNPIHLSSASLKKYVGDYRSRRISFRDDSLFYQQQGRKEFRLLPLSEDTFLLEGYSYDFRIRFSTDAFGKATKLFVLTLDGRKKEFVRN